MNNNMTLLNDSVEQFFKDEQTRNSIKEICKPIGQIIYEEFFIYVAIFSIYNMLMFILVLVILLLLLKLVKTEKIKYNYIV